MSCPCNQCNGIITNYELHGFYGSDASRFQDEEPEEKQPKSIWERIANVSDELNAYGVPTKFINELNDICDTIDSIDDDINKLQKLCVNKPIDFTQYRLGELSQKIY